MTFAKYTMALTLAGVCVAGAATAEEMTLKFTHVYPANHYMWINSGKFMLDMITEKTGGDITFEVYPAGQLGKDNIGNLNSGLADMSFISTSLEVKNIPLSSVLELPGAYRTPCEGASMMASMMGEGAILDELELQRNELKFLSSAMFPQYAIISADKQVKTGDDLAGLKIRAGGAAITQTFGLLDAVPIQVPGSELFDALKRGTLDAAFFPEIAVPAYDLQNVVKYSLRDVQLGAASTFIAISDSAWEKLTDEQKAIFREAGAAAQTNFCEWITAETDNVRQMMIESGVEEIDMAAEDREAMHARITSVTTDWVQDLESAGKPAQQVLEAMNALKIN